MDFSQWDKENPNMAQAVDENEKEHQLEKVPIGSYEVKILDLCLTESKAGKPMLKAEYQILPNQKYAGSHMWQYKLCDQATGINITRGFLSTLTPKSDHISIAYTSMNQFAKDIQDLFNQIKGKYEYKIEYTLTDKGYDSFKVVDIFEAKQPEPQNPFEDNEPLPFD